ncbi:hypothetical protein E1B28_011348 [Marasmius oreades]|uniref:YDG domain-containing protein n=1 Tax=Marasmius oreades TaxID=181124 RepID=A0A9P7RUI2_9AGAR|nr:uncharacterized protein E1B28_011348 [Marasmius oreades]KAG7089693.1 hypothetical protein E1B28_011348 [Marasmius oreades]
MGGKSLHPKFHLTRKKYDRRDYYYGAPKDCPVGALFQDRQTLSQAMVHGFTQAGIHGNIESGTYSVVMSGGYEDDDDQGEWFWYTGEGGRSAAGKQIKDQSWKDKGNRSLMMSTMHPRRPVRVVRAHIAKSPYGPAEGLRYDGLYQVIRVCTAKGKSGHKICKALFRRLGNQAPLPSPRWTVRRQGEEIDATLRRSSRDIVESTGSEEGYSSGSQVEEAEEEEELDTETATDFVSKSPNPVTSIFVRKRQRSEDDLDARITQRPRESIIDPTCTLPEKASLSSVRRRKYQNLPKIAKMNKENQSRKESC